MQILTPVVTPLSSIVACELGMVVASHVSSIVGLNCVNHGVYSGVSPGT